MLKQHGDASGAFDTKPTKSKVVLTSTPRPRRPLTSQSSKVSESRTAGIIVAKKGENPSDQAEPGISFIVTQIKNQLKSRGANGLHGLARRFRIMDNDGSRSLDFAEWKKALRDVSVDIPDKDLRLVFGLFDSDRSGSINFEEFLAGLVDPMNEARLGVVRSAFTQLDRDRNGVIDVADIRHTFNASKHPDVRSGLKTEEDVLTEFLHGFDQTKGTRVWRDSSSKCLDENEAVWLVDEIYI